ncbi:MAG: glutamine-hydrolyzing carbamoyl-phosphate synthase small subunit [Verrucomicrobiae bacterium]|nr:glutamine-hydrolyzing carbamoyl-phosphate synthase small subunit [Verrucomicrobiae bacterium]
MKEAILALEDGFILRGKAVGSLKPALGEVCFNTAMTGYEEVLTDPSYKGQIVAMTYPQIGNYGINEEDQESLRPQVNGFVMRELSPMVSNWRSRLSLEEYLLKNDIAAIEQVDTRALTKHLRTRGALRGVITSEKLSDVAASDLAKSFSYEGVDFVKEVTTKQTYFWDEKGEKSSAWPFPQSSLEPLRYRVVAYDFGMKHNILRCLRRSGFQVKVVPANTSANEVLRDNPDGIFLSNGPGDPAALTYAHRNIRDLIGKKPMFGICLGHQIISYALGGKTFKLKFGHRGANQPVKDLRTGKIAITSQNHGFAVATDSLPSEVEVTQVNLNDNTCEGLAHRTLNLFSVQYHPEASPGPSDASYLFQEFAKRIESSQK